MATTTTTTPKPAPAPAAPEAPKKHPFDPADELSEPYDPAKAQPYKPAPYMTDEKPAAETPTKSAGSTTYTS
jgi:hypothetical protein